MRTTTGWLDRVVRLDVDLAGLLVVEVDFACDWKAGALRARRAADCVWARVFVSVVVVLGTELVLVVRSEGGSCASGEGAWAMMAGTGDAASGFRSSNCGLLPLRQSVDSATDCRVVVAGVTVGGSVAGSWRPAAMGGPWWSGGQILTSLPSTRAAAVSGGQLAGVRFAAVSGIVGFALLELQRGVHGRYAP